MHRCLPCRNSSLGGVAPCAVAFALCVVVAGVPAQAQSGRISVTGYVSPRCWVAPVEPQSPGTTLQVAAPEMGQAVRCTDRRLQVQVEQSRRQFRTMIDGAEISPQPATTIIIAPRA